MVKTRVIKRCKYAAEQQGFVDLMLEFSPELWILALVTALIASAITTIASIGVGLIIFGVLSFFVDLKTIIPFVAVAQLFGVSVRYWVFRRHIHWRLASLFILGAIPGVSGIIRDAISPPVIGRNTQPGRPQARHCLKLCAYQANRTTWQKPRI